MKTRNFIVMAALGLASLPAHCQLASGVNYNATTPTAPQGTRNITFQHDNSRPTVNASAYVTYPTLQVPCPTGADLSAAVNVMLGAAPSEMGGIIDARACNTDYRWDNATTIHTANTVLLLPCGTLTATQPITVAYGTRNVAIHGCSYQGGSDASGTQGGTVFNWTGTGNPFTVGDPTFLNDTGGFSLTDMSVVTASGDLSAVAVALYRVQELNLERLYLIGNNGLGQTGIMMNGYGNYTGGQFIGLHIAGFGSALTMTGASLGAANASTFVRLHIDCPTYLGNPISGTYGINLAYGDGNTFIGGDVESCDTAFYFGAGASNNTLVGIRNEQNTTQVLADPGSSYNLFLAGGTIFTGSMTDGGTHNTFWDSFHRQFNNLNGDLWRSQADTTVTDHVYTGIGLGHVRGRLQEWQTDVPSSPGAYQNAWEWGPGDEAGGRQLWTLLDMLSNVARFGAAETTAGGGNDQTFLNATGTANVCINCSAGSGTGGFVVDSGGATPTAVLTVDSSGNLSIPGQLNFYSGSTAAYEWECQSGTSCTLYNPNATVPARVFKANVNGGTEIDSEASSAVTVNNTSTGGTGGFIVYEGGSNYGTRAFSVSGAGVTQQPGDSQVGSASGTGNIVLGNHLNQLATADYAGSCALSTSASCTVSFQHSWNSQPACSVTPGFQPSAYIWYTWATNVVTVHASANQSGALYVICVGNPN